MRRARENLKRYNNAFSFVSYGMDCFTEPSSTHGPKVTICHGTVYHLSGFIPAEDKENANYAQVYLYDPNEALEIRTGNPYYRDLDESVIQDL